MAAAARAAGDVGANAGWDGRRATGRHAFIAVLVHGQLPAPWPCVHISRCIGIITHRYLGITAPTRMHVPRILAYVVSGVQLAALAACCKLQYCVAWVCTPYRYARN